MERPYDPTTPEEMERWDRAARRSDELRERADDDAEEADPVAHHDPHGAMPERMREKLRRGEAIEPDDFSR